MVFCEKCGKPMNNDDAFCAYCGAPAAGKALQPVGARKPVSSGKMVDKDGNELIECSYSESDDFEDYENDDEDDEDDEDEWRAEDIYKEMDNIISEYIITIAGTLSNDIIISSKPESAYPENVLLYLLKTHYYKCHKTLSDAIEEKNEISDDIYDGIYNYAETLSKVVRSIINTEEDSKFWTDYDIYEKAESTKRMAYAAICACGKIIEDIRDDVNLFETFERNIIQNNLIRTKCAIENYPKEVDSLLREGRTKGRAEVEIAIYNIWTSAHAVQFACDSYIKLRHLTEE